jgi:F-type H+-transporting ATPase subunit epsilon
MTCLKLDIVDSEKQIFSGEVDHLVAPAILGEIGIYPNHIPIISKLKPGILRLQVPNEKEQIILAISGGFLEVENNHATVLADIIERTDDLDSVRLETQKKEALAKLKSGELANSNKAEVSLDLAIAGLKAMDYIKKHIKK